ncbi:membrane-associated, eicosanoid/glutathione metabolism protein [Aspergillus desertorum]
MSSLHVPGLLRPVIALNGWTFVMEIWMYATRIPVFSRMKPSNTTTKSDADNYNHLFEQPTQFYAVALALAIVRHGEDDPVDIFLAWAYVGLRVLHSFVHVTKNKVMLRFGVFVISSGVLAAMTGRAALLVF